MHIQTLKTVRTYCTRWLCSTYIEALTSPCSGLLPRFRVAELLIVEIVSDKVELSTSPACCCITLPLYRTTNYSYASIFASFLKFGHPLPSIVALTFTEWDASIPAYLAMENTGSYEAIDSAGVKLEQCSHPILRQNTLTIPRQVAVVT